LLISVCLSGADDAADIVATHDSYNKQDVPTVHAEGLNPLFSIIEAIVDTFDFSGICEPTRSSPEARVMPDEIGGRLGVIPLIFHKSTGYPYQAQGKIGRLEGLSDGQQPAFPH